MSANVGTIDRALRFLAGTGLIIIAYFESLAFLSSPAMKYAAMAIGVIMIGTAVMRFCPAYTILGIKTCKAS